MRGWAQPPLTSRLRRLASRAWDLLARRRRDADLDEEIAAHLELAVAEQRANGLSEEDARAAAARHFGGVLRAKERYRDGRGFPLLDACLQELRYSIRGLRKQWTFTVVAVLTLALAIGANAAIFSVVYNTLIKPLPYHDADRLVLIHTERDVVGSNAPEPIWFWPSEFLDWQARLGSAASVAFFSSRSFTVSTADGLEMVRGAVVSDSFFSTLQGPLDVGRPLVASDARSPTVVISRHLAQQLFPGPHRAIGEQLILNRRPYTVVGVADSSFSFPEPTTDLWTPALYQQIVNAEEIGFVPIIRLKSGETIERARGAVAAAARTLAPGNLEGVSTSLVSLRADQMASTRPTILILWATVILVLLVASANVANLLVARKASRAQETAVRMALGASRGRLLFRDLVDATILSALGTLAGTALCIAAIDAAVRLRLTDASHLARVQVSTPVLLFACLIGAITAIAIGLIPVLRRLDPAVVNRASGPALAGGGGRRVRQALCVGELAMAIVLLVSGILLGRSLVKLLHIDIGVNTSHVATAALNLNFGLRRTDAQKIELAGEIVSRVRQLPEVQRAGIGVSLPPNVSGARITMTASPGSDESYQAEAISSTPGYLPALGVRLLEGRFFTAGDDLSHPSVVILSVDTARRWFGAEDPLGRTMVMPTLLNGQKGTAKATVVGVIADVKYAGLTKAADDQIYAPFAQQPWSRVFLVAKTAGDPAALSSALRRAVASVDPTIVLSSIQPLDKVVSVVTAPPRTRTFLLDGFAGLALAIAAVGLYGVIAYSVTQRTLEIGIRMALGARTADVMRMVLREGAVLGIAGVAIGLAAAYGVTRLLASLLYGVSATDPFSFVLAAAILLAVVLVASYLPARRAAHVDPLVALRAE